MTDSTMDFAGEGGDDSLLSLLDQQFGQQAEQASQQATMDQAASEADKPAPPDAPVAPPAQNMASLPIGGAPNMPPSAMQPAAPVGPGTQLAPGPNVAAPSPVLNPAHPAQLRPGPQAQEVQNNAVQNETAVRKAESSGEKAELEKAQAETEYAEATQPLFDMQAEAAHRELQARDIVQNWFAVQTNKVAANTQSDLDRQEKLLAENPRDYWGNHNTAQKIGAVVAIIGAGFSGNALGFAESLVNKDIADYNRRAGILDKIQGLHREQDRQLQNTYQNADEAIKTRSIATYNYILKSLQQKRNATTSKFQQANYDQAIAGLQTKLADDIAALNKDKLAKLADQQEFDLKWAMLAQREKEEQSRVGAQADNSIPYEDMEQTVPGGKQGVDPRVNHDVKKKHDLYVGGIEDANKFEEGIASLDRGEQSFAETKATLEPYISHLFAVARDLAGAGARLEGSEQKLVESMALGWKDFVAGKITGVEMAKKVNAVKSMLAHRATTLTTENTPGLRPKKDSAIGKVLETERQQTEASTLERAVLQQALANSKTPEAKKLVLERLAKEGNKAAKSMLTAKSKSHWYNPEHWIDWSNNREAPAE